MQLGNFVDVLYYPVASSWHFTLYHEEDARSKIPPLGLSFCATRAFGQDSAVQRKLERCYKKCRYSRRKMKNVLRQNTPFSYVAVVF